MYALLLTLLSKKLTPTDPGTSRDVLPVKGKFLNILLMRNASSQFLKQILIAG